MVRKLRCCRARRARMAGSSVGPSTPQFHERLWFSPSALPSPLAVVVLVVVGDQIAQREPVVGGHEVDAGVGPAGVVLVQVGAAGQPGGQLVDRARFAPPEVADGVTVLPVPLGPQRREVPDLVAALPEVPRLGDQLDLADDRVLLDEVEERGQPIDLVELASQRGRQIEAEAVDVHLGHPVPEAVHDQLQRVRMPHVETVARPGGVVVVERVVGHEPVVGRVVDPLERQHRPEVVALGRVVVDDVEDDLDAGGVEVAHHGLELGDLLAQPARAAVLVVGGEEPDRVVAPVVAQVTIDQMGVVDELVDGQQLDGSDPECGEVLDGGRVGQAGVGPAQLAGDVGVGGGEPLDVDLVDDRLVQRDAERPVVAPVEERVVDDALLDMDRAVVVVARPFVAEVVREAGRLPVDRSLDRLGVGIDDELSRIEAQTDVGRPFAVDAVAVALAGPDVGQEGVPAVGVDLVEMDAPLRSVIIEQAELHAMGRLAEQREVGARPVEVGAERVRPPGPGLDPPHECRTSTPTGNRVSRSPTELRPPSTST